MFVYFKFITLKVQAGDYLNLMENLGFKFSVSDFHSVKFGSTKHVVLVLMGRSRYRSSFS